MKDNITLIAAATGGFMLSIALSGILKGAPVTSSQHSAVSSQQSAFSIQQSAVRIANNRFNL